MFKRRDHVVILIDATTKKTVIGSIVKVEESCLLVSIPGIYQPQRISHDLVVSNITSEIGGK